MNAEIIEKAIPPLNVLFVHGMWHGAWCWENFERYFAASRLRFAPFHPFNLRHHGANPDLKRLRWTSLGEYAEDVVEAASRMSPPLIMIGHSMGAWLIARSFAQIRPEAVVLLAPASPASFWSASLRFARQNFCRYLCANLKRSPYVAVKSPRQARQLLFSPHMPEEDVYRHHARLQEESFLVNLQMLWPCSPYRRIENMPALVLGAEHDPAVRPKHARATARRLGATVEILPCVAHDMMLDVAWGTVAKRVVKWLEDLGCDGHFTGKHIT